MECTHFCNDRKNYSRDTVSPSPIPIIKFNELMNSNDVEILKSLTKDNYQSCLLVLNLSQRTVYTLLLFLYLSIFFPYPYLISMIICINLIMYLMYQWSGLWVNKELKLKISHHFIHSCWPPRYQILISKYQNCPLFIIKWTLE